VSPEERSSSDPDGWSVVCVCVCVCVERERESERARQTDRQTEREREREREREACGREGGSGGRELCGPEVRSSWLSGWGQVLPCPDKSTMELRQGALAMWRRPLRLEKLRLCPLLCWHLSAAALRHSSECCRRRDRTCAGSGDA
jgi:hypothetical protein